MSNKPNPTPVAAAPKAPKAAASPPRPRPRFSGPKAGELHAARRSMHVDRIAPPPARVERSDEHEDEEDDS